ncbi:MAG TPA: NAD(P)H:quinone oxidoreductase [Verrucomicrobiae bacterium]|nr:NAD(P)H:quinone oxidoreductase [Verrucomicrobiae bacterium]
MKVLIVYYSMYGHTYRMARAVEKGVASVSGVEPVLRRVQEFDEVLKATAQSQHAQALREQTKNIPVCTLDDLRQADGVLFGSPTRYGNMTAQMKNLIDSTGELWMKGEMEGKPAGVFTSTATTHGGQETTLVSMMIPLLHLGMVIAGVPYSLPGMIHTEGRGGTPYGASCVAGPKGELEPRPEDLQLAEAQGKRVAEMTLKLRGKH